MNAYDKTIEAFEKHRFDRINEHDFILCRCSREFVTAVELDEHTKFAVANTMHNWHMELHNKFRTALGL
jgi:hypothetical protein